MEQKERLFISFSGGRTSAYMLLWILDNCADKYETVILFANTGQEHEGTLVFVDQVDKLIQQFGHKITYVEAVVHPEMRVGTTHRVVTFESAHRGEAIFEDMIKKYGIPNKNYPHCTRELKLRPMLSYLRSIGWKTGTFKTAIGIRSDEADRMDPDFETKKYWYPLIEQGITKDFVRSFWSKQSFDLCVKEHYGNCQTCWKKSTRKLLTLVREKPSLFEFNYRMEKRYAHAGAGQGPRVFFRGRKSTEDLFALSLEPFEEFVEGDPDQERQTTDFDKANGCSESCEPFVIEDEEI